MKEKTALVGAWVNPEIHSRLSDLASKNERSVSAEMRVALTAHLERAGGSASAEPPSAAEREATAV